MSIKWTSFLVEKFNMYHFFVKDFPFRNSSTNRGKGLLFYHQQMHKHLKNYFLPRGPSSLSSGIFQVWEAKVLLNIGEATQMNCGPNTLGSICSPKRKVVVVLLQLAMLSGRGPGLSWGHTEPDSVPQAATLFLWQSRALGREKEGWDGRAWTLARLITELWIDLEWGLFSPPKLQVFVCSLLSLRVGN